MTYVTANNKRISKNTLMLYVRMFFIMAVSLYSSRVILSSLGVTDFGIFDVVGGVVAMMGILKGLGLNILLNMFFSPVVNASWDIAYQINSAITQFFTNFYTAASPPNSEMLCLGKL